MENADVSKRDQVLSRLQESPHARRAMENFRKGYNCSQALVLAFEEEHGLDERMILRLSSSFGGGMGRLREVCGSVSGMFMVAGLLYGYDDPKDFEGKKTHYARIQELAGVFQEINGSIVCRNLLGLSGGADVPVPEKRTQEYYRKRPCEQIIGISAMILEEYIQKNAPGSLGGEQIAAAEWKEE